MRMVKFQWFSQIVNFEGTFAPLLWLHVVKLHMYKTVNSPPKTASWGKLLTLNSILHSYVLLV